MQLQQNIHFCTSPDGVRLAMATTGSGPPLIRVSTWLSHLECDQREEDTWATIQELSRDHTCVRYDARGCGLSDRRIPSLTFDDLVADLGAVVDAHGPEPMPLYGLSCGAPIAIAYAARYPLRVSRLILLNGYGRAYFSAKHPEPSVLEEANLLLHNLRVGWNNDSSAFRQIFVAQLLGNADSAMRREIDERMRLSMTPEMAERHLRSNYAMDVKAECAQVQCPTLVLHARGDQMVNFEQGRKLAAWIPGARFVPLESDSHVLLGGQPAARQFFSEMRTFLGLDEKVPTNPIHLSQRQTEMLACVSLGQTDKQIARALGLSPRTVEMHVAGAMKALHCSTRAQAVHKAMQEGLLTV